MLELGFENLSLMVEEHFRIQRHILMMAFAHQAATALPRFVVSWK